MSNDETVIPRVYLSSILEFDAAISAKAGTFVRSCFAYLFDVMCSSNELCLGSS